MTTSKRVDWLPQINTIAPLVPLDPPNLSLAAEAEVRLEYKIDAYLFRQQWAAAAQALEERGEALLGQGFGHIVQDWLETLPTPLLEEHPQLLYLLAICAWRQGQFYVAHRLLKRSLSGFERSGNVAGQGKVLANLAVCAVILEDVEGSKRWAERALARPLPVWQRLHLLMSRTWLNFTARRWDDAGRDFGEAATVVRACHQRAGLRALSMQLHPTLSLLPDGLSQLEIIAGHIETCAPDDAYWHCHLAWQHTFIRWQRGEWSQALRLARETLQAGEQLRHRDYGLETDLLAMAANIHTAQGRYMQATDYFFRMLNRQPLLKTANPLRLKYLYDLGRKHWLQGNRRSVAQIQRQIAAAPERDRLLPQPMLATMLAGLLALLDRREQAAEQALRRAIALQTDGVLFGIVANPHLLLAHLYLRQNRLALALTEFIPVLARCDRENRPAPILQEGAVMKPLLRLAAQRGLHAPFARRLLDLLRCPPEVEVFDRQD